jgi:biotin synthase-like enzyme
LIIQATIGCPHNRCAFCSMYGDKDFKKRPIAEVVEDLDMAVEAYGEGVRTIFLADGNTAALPTATLVAIGDAARERFPHLERITMYGSAKFLAKKSGDEWRRIGGAGITRVHSGLESGDPVTLEQIRKGVDPDCAAAAFNHVMAAGIELSVYLMVGVAGLERWREHAEGSAAVLNRASPDFVRLRTFVPRLGTDWCDRWQSGELTLLDAHQALEETRLLVERLDGPTVLLSDHVTNFLDVNGHLPDDRNLMLETIDEALTWPLSRFRPPTERLIRLGL